MCSAGDDGGTLAGGYHSLAVTSTGQLYAFGLNNDGQLGSMANNKTAEPNPTPALVTLPGANGPVTTGRSKPVTLRFVILGG